MIEALRKPITIEQFSLEKPPPETIEGAEKEVREPEKQIPVSVETKAPPITVQTTPKSSNGIYVASKSSNKYHLPTCSGAKKITEANKIWFSSKQEAERAGYSPAGNCKGI